jgi:competence protein ComEC
MLDAVRELIINTAQQSLPEPQASLLLGMMIGVKGSFPSSFYEALRATGTLHVVVVSGYNITVLINTVAKSLPFLSLRVRALVTALVIFLFVSLVGFDPPVVRAAIMGTIALLGTVLGRQKDALRILLITAGLMLIVNPSWLGNLSFQLSFLATLGLTIFYPLLDRYLPGKGMPLREDLVTTLAAQTLVWPLIAYTFGQVSLLSPLVNTLVLWSVPIATILGLVTTALAVFASRVGYLIMLPVNLLLTYFARVVECFASLDIGFFEILPFSVLALLFYYVVLGGGLWFLSQLSPRKQKTN